MKQLTPRLLLAAALLPAAASSAATQTWDDPNSANTWDTTTLNWDAGTVAWTNGNDAIFGGTGETVTLGAGITAGSLTFNSTGYTISSNTLTLSGATPTVTVTNLADTATFTSSISATGTLTKSGLGTLVLNAANTVSTVDVTAGTLAITGQYTNNRLSNGATVTVQSGATVDIRTDNPLPTSSLANAVSFVLNGGTLTSTGGNHAHVGNITLSNGGTLTTGTGAASYDNERWKVWGDFAVSNSGGNTTAATISGNGVGLVGVRTFNVADVTGSSATDLAVSANLNNGENSVGGVLKTGAGTMTLTGTHEYSGTTTVGEGTLAIAGSFNGAGAATVNNGGRLSVTGTMRNSTTLTVNSGGTLDTGGTNIFVSGHGVALADARKIVVDGGTWVISGGESRIGNVDLKNGATWTSNRGLSSWDWLLGNTASGAATVTVSGTGAATMNGTGGIHLQGVQNFDVADTTGSAAADLTVSMTLDNAGSTGGAAGGINKLGAGTMAISKQTTYSGGTTVGAGVLDLTGGGGSGGTLRGTVTVSDTATLRLSTGDALGYNNDASAVNAIHLNGGTMTSAAGSNQTTTAKFHLTGGTINGTVNLDLFSNNSSVTTYASANESTISVATMNLRQNDTVFDVADGAAARDLVISSVIGNGDAGNHKMIKQGAGTMELTGANTYNGGTSVTAGTLVAANASALGTGAVSLSGGTLSTSLANVTAGAVTLEGGALSLNGTGAGALTLAANQNLVITSGQWNVDLANGPDQILGSGTGTFSISGGVLDLGNGTINYTNTYQLISGFASGTVTGGTIQGYDTSSWAAQLDNTGLLSFTAVPEPSTYGLLGAGALAAVAFVRRRRKAL